MMTKSTMTHHSHDDLTSKWMSPGMRNSSFSTPRHQKSQSEHGWFWAMAHKAMRHQ